MPLPNGQLQTQSLDGEDGSRMWTAQWAEPPHQVAYPGYEYKQPDLVDPRTEFLPGIELPHSIPMNLGVST